LFWSNVADVKSNLGSGVLLSSFDDDIWETWMNEQIHPPWNSAHGCSEYAQNGELIDVVIFKFVDFPLIFFKTK